MLLRDAAPSEPRSAQVIYPAAFHAHREETPQQWAENAVSEHLAARAAAFARQARERGAATPAIQPDYRQDPRTGRLEAAGFGAGLAFQGSSIVAALPQPPRGWMARLLGGAL